MNSTGIAWTDYTWNVFSGCKKISPECQQCYADTLAERHRGGPAFPHGFDLTVRAHKLVEPTRLMKGAGPSLIFCESMSDIGLDDGELTSAELGRLLAAGFASMDRLRDAFFASMSGALTHRYQLVTKRPKTLLRYLRERPHLREVLASCWVGVTIGHASALDRLDDLHAFRELGARVLFISAEPLLSNLVDKGMRLDGIDWLIAGGESGAHAGNPKHAPRLLVARAGRPEGRYLRWAPRPQAIRWLQRLRDEAARAGCAFFFKQWGGPTPASGGRHLDGVEHDGMPVHVPGAMPERREDIGHATAALARKRLPLAPEAGR